MKIILSFLAAVIASITSFSQFLSVEVEPYFIHVGPTPDGVDLDGYTTYRLYVTLGNESDFCSSIYGDVASPLIIESTTGFWQSPFGGLTGSDINPLLLPAFPSLEYDSFVTIGRSSSGEPGGAINTVESACDPWATSFNAGGAIEMDCLIGGVWFALNGDSNGLAGDDFRVLIGQFTTDGILSGTINVQVFPLGVGADEQRISGISFSTDLNAVIGCTDPTALNYNELATQDNGTCIFPCGLVVNEVLITPNSCAGGENAEVFIETTGGQGQISYRLNGGPVQLSPVFDDLEAGLYLIEVEDGQGCLTDSEFTLEDPAQLTISASISEHVLCSGDQNGVISALAVGGTGAILFGLAPDEILNENPVFSGLSPGSYLIYAMDTNGCTATSGALILEEPDPIAITSVLTSASECGNNGNGSLSVAADGGTGQKVFSLDGENFQINGSFSGLSPGNYIVFIQDANLCEINLPIEIAGPQPVLADPVITDNYCAQGAEGIVDLNLSGGEGNLLVSMNGAEFESGEVFGNLPTGMNEAEILDESNGCSFILPFVIGGGPEVVFDYISTDVLCAGEASGLIVVQAEGGYGDLQYAFDGETFSPDNSLESVPAGIHIVLITDSEGCVYSFLAEVSEPEPVGIIGEINPDQGGTNGAIDLDITGGVPPYSIQWVGPNGFFSAEEDISSLEEGVYTVEITDANGCIASESFNLPLGLEEIRDSVECLLYPNPAQDFVRLELPTFLHQTVGILFFDMEGRLVKFAEVPSGIEQVRIDLRALSPGTYTVIIQAGNVRFANKLIKQEGF